jgi:hypothetical protein
VRVELALEAPLTAGHRHPVVILLSGAGTSVGLAGVHVDLRAVETVHLAPGEPVERSTMELSILVAPGFVLHADEQRYLVGSFTVPAAARPSYLGLNARHTWWVRARAEGGTDSGYRPIELR